MSDPTNPADAREQEREAEKHDPHERAPSGEDEAGTRVPTPPSEDDDDKAAPPGIHT